MKVLDPGHLYTLDHLDGDSVEYLRFVKREGSGFPGNVGHYEGTNLQEVLRVLIDRLKYLDQQLTDICNYKCISYLRDCIEELEIRAAKRHNIDPILVWNISNHYNIEEVKTCSHCGHIVCKELGNA